MRRTSHGQSERLITLTELLNLQERHLRCYERQTPKVIDQSLTLGPSLPTLTQGPSLPTLKWVETFKGGRDGPSVRFRSIVY